ncbi:MAG TPA: hypothetical protein VFV38_04235 [Ktedonobacteraceae bacterium]|nr:hypothetical protein [Ktedonobacteraceae bacterium]
METLEGIFFLMAKIMDQRRSRSEPGPKVFFLPLVATHASTRASSVATCADVCATLLIDRTGVALTGEMMLKVIR